jgi:hypothetical protein
VCIFILFISGLFNDAVGILDCIASKDSMQARGRRILSEGNRSPGRDLKP